MANIDDRNKNKNEDDNHLIKRSDSYPIPSVAHDMIEDKEMLNLAPFSMENCQQLAEPLALAVSTSLKKQEVEVNQAVLTSYLLDIHPDPGILSRLELENQIDSQGNFGNVSISLAKIEDRDYVKREEGVEEIKN